MANVSSSNSQGELVPRLRFPGFEGEWDEKTLADFLSENTTRNRDGRFEKREVLSVSGEFGIVNQMEFQGRSFAGESVADYHVVETGDIVYTKSPLKASPYGIIKYNSGVPGIVSTLYAVYHPRKSVNSKFVDYYFQNDLRLNKYLKPLVNIGAKHDMKVNNEAALMGTVVFPDKKEQDAIVDFLSIVDTRIDKQRQLIEFLKSYKRGLNKRLISQISSDHVVSLDQVCSIVGGGTPDTADDTLWGNEINWFTPSEVGTQKYVDKSTRKISAKGLTSSSAKILPVGTVLLTTRATLGEMSIAWVECTTNQGFQSLIPNTEIVSSEYLYYLQVCIKPWCEKYAAGNTFREISKQNLGKCPVPVPSKEEQSTIVAVLQKIDRNIDCQTVSLDKLLLLKNALLQRLFI